MVAAMTDKKVSLITGANRGLGLEIARQLGQQGIVAVIGSRDKAKGQAAADTIKTAGIDAHAVKLDVTNADDIAALPAYFEKNFGRLDILINNAGISLEARGQHTPEAFRLIFETNVIAPWFIAQALLPLLKEAPGGRIVNQSSILGSITTMSSDGHLRTVLLPAYNSSKTALNMLTVQLAYSLRDTRIKVNSAHPGWVKTDMGGARAPLEIVDGAKTAVTLALLPDDGPTGGFFHLGKELPW
jgi:NAD(P)-dependent dehydrogenase (short-subunit alcohol dehydrogenase family)